MQHVFGDARCGDPLHSETLRREQGSFLWLWLTTAAFPHLSRLARPRPHVCKHTIRPGQLPAFERHEYVSSQEADDFAAARAIIAYARKNVKDLDAQLPPAQHADVLAFSVMVDARLNVATTACIWLEPRGFAEFKKVWPRRRSARAGARA